ncbi:PREDICTED: uncharacterized protein LOC108379939, partial [Rhagoletis zephyria]|uniref:uncharacterized protein LOC108379939 n=1 Tax=Rhagoletis zephyria TaxID=28612 RepID=UPI0008112A37
IPLPSTPSKQVTHTTIETRENNIIPTRNDSTNALQKDIHSMKADLLGGGASSASSSHSATISMSAGNGNGMSALGGANINAVDRKGTLAIGKSMYYTEQPPKQLDGSAADRLHKSPSIFYLCRFALIFLLLRNHS